MSSSSISHERRTLFVTPSASINTDHQIQEGDRGGRDRGGKVQKRVKTVNPRRKGRHLINRTLPDDQNVVNISTPQFDVAKIWIRGG
ncbi:hypothetical protein NDU88_004668 [Pleurodeles waltl]|uniref:Uncharacterized protein n=1 Tax=Pleurodeles waltl TaxID=8319 RepID=A0AAV7PLM1_PLEWA|nr:hypothetical protein NDU88_004668 [Pleurodeles waltl]